MFVREELALFNILSENLKSSINKRLIVSGISRTPCKQTIGVNLCAIIIRSAHMRDMKNSLIIAYDELTLEPPGVESFIIGNFNLKIIEREAFAALKSFEQSFAESGDTRA